MREPRGSDLFLGRRAERQRGEQKKEAPRGIPLEQSLEERENERIPAERGVEGVEEGSHGLGVEGVPAEQEGLQRGVPEGVSLRVRGAVGENGREIAVRVEEEGENEREGGGEAEEVDEGELGGREGPARDEQRDELRHVEQSLRGADQRCARARSQAEAEGRRVDARRGAAQHGAEHLHAAVLQKVARRAPRQRQQRQPIGGLHAQRRGEPRGDRGNRLQLRVRRARVREKGRQTAADELGERRSGEQREQQRAESGAHEIGIADFGERRGGLAERPLVEGAQLVGGEGGFAEGNAVEEQREERFARREARGATLTRRVR